MSELSFDNATAVEGLTSKIGRNGAEADRH
jgi:hypothetical protein